MIGGGQEDAHGAQDLSKLIDPAVMGRGPALDACLV